MDIKKIKEAIKKTWNWIWHSDSIWSWIVALAIIWIVIKFIFLPGLSLAFGTSLPLAGVESSSMDHQILLDDYNRLVLCDKTYPKEDKKEIGYIEFEKYWEICGSWYENKDITKEQFSDFPMHNGFKKGDIIIVFGRLTLKVGDVIIFKPNPESLAPRPIIHRIIAINDDRTYQTKGDHNEKQLTTSNNKYKTDETKIIVTEIINSFKE